MTKEKMLDYAPSLWLLMPTLINIVAEKRDIDFMKALELVYNSKLYRDMENEQAKIWHFSEETLADWIKLELDGKSFEYPEVG